MKKWSKFFKILYFILIIVMVTGCIQKKESNSNGRSYLVYNMEKLPDSLLFPTDTDIRQEDLFLCLFEGLISTDSNGNIVPALAKNWSISEDKLTYTFYLRENAKWSDGDKIISKDFVDFFSKILREGRSIYDNQLNCIFGVKDYVDKKTNFDKVAITAKDKEILEIRLNYPCNYLLDILSQPIFSLRKDFYSLKNWKYEHKKIKYTGPFFIEQLFSNGEVFLKKNSQYWDGEKVVTDAIQISNKEINAFALAKYKLNQIDILTSVPIGEMVNIEENEKILKGPTAVGVYLGFNLNKSIVKDIDFRKAISSAINREEIEKDLNGILTKSSLYIPNNIKGIGKRENYFNITSSSGVVESNIWNINYNGEKLKIVYLNSDDSIKVMARNIVQDLKNININAYAEGYGNLELKEVISKQDYHMILTNYTGFYDSPVSFLENWVSDSNFNILGYKNAIFEEHILLGKIFSDGEEAKKNFIIAEDILLKDMAFIPLGFYNSMVCKKPYINGIEINKRGNIILKEMYVDEIESKTP